jgi:hypothetical protein
MFMPDQLAGLIPRRSKTHTEHSIVEATLKHDQEILTGHALLLIRLLEVLPKLALEHSIHALDLLFFPELNRKIRLFSESCLTVLARGKGSAFKRTFVGITPIPFQKQLQSFTPAASTRCPCISCQLSLR